jgi:hypothetical protein
MTVPSIDVVLSPKYKIRKRAIIKPVIIEATKPE